MRLSRRGGVGVGPGLAGALALAAAAGAVVTGSAGPARAADADCTTVAADATTGSATSASVPAGLLDLAQAQALVRGRPGEGQTVAVVDSGIAASPLLADVEHPFRAAPVVDPHGTAVAGLVAGAPQPDGAPVGAAPAARLLDVRVYDQWPVTVEGTTGPTSASVADGLAWVHRHRREESVGVVVVAVAVPDSPRLARVVRRLVRSDVVVVAASGNRPREEGDPLYAALGRRVPGEDAADLVFPAGYPGVVAVSATAEGAPGVDARDEVLASSAVAVAAPTFGAVSVGLHGETCVLPQVATSWAAAQVAGVVALLRQRYPDDTAPQIVARLVDTASGRPDDRTRAVGAGVVQPVEALTRPLSPSREGQVPRDPVGGDGAAPAVAPEPAYSAVPEVRDAARWWALAGGALLVLAMVARPLVARRR